MPYAHGNRGQPSSVNHALDPEHVACRHALRTPRIRHRARARRSRRPATTPSAGRSTGSTSTRSPIRACCNPLRRPRRFDRTRRVPWMRGKTNGSPAPAAIRRVARRLHRRRGLARWGEKRIVEYQPIRVLMSVLLMRRGADPDQHLVRRPASGTATSSRILELLRAAVALEQHRLHGARNHGAEGRRRQVIPSPHAGSLRAGSRNSRPCRRRRCAPR